MSPTTTEQQNQEIINALSQQGWCVIENYFPLQLAQQLANEALHLYQNQQMQAAGIGRGNQFQRNTDIRQDCIYWLNNKSPAQQQYLEKMETLKLELNRKLYLGLKELEAHYAVYPPGGFYQKHLDSFQGTANRIVSVVTYLNFNWPKDAGGELLIYPPEDDLLIVSVTPEAGKLIVFLSEEIPHAVKAAQQQRLSIAGWFRMNKSNIAI